MSLPASQRRTLSQIEKTLADDHPGLGPLFAIFTRLTGHEPMPVTERVTARRWRWRRIRPAVVTLVGLAMATGALLTISLLLPSPQVCVPSTVTTVAANAPPGSTGRQPGCATQQNKPGNTSQSGLYAR
jgi:gentisate 1,2-dioxygenase